MRRAAWTCCASVLIGSSLLAAGADPAPTTRPTTAPAAQPPGLAPGSRIIKTFDFEEQALGNFDTVPMFWAKLTGNGYPLYTGGHFDTSITRSANHSFKLELDGGSVAYQLTPGSIKISPNADFFLIGFVKTTRLAHAKAQLTVWFADDQDQIITDTKFVTEPYASPNGESDDWHLLHLYLPANPKARSVVLQLGVYQPQQLGATNPSGDLGKFALYEQDIKGAGWFDDISIFQLPRVTLATNAAANVASPGTPLELAMSVSDLGRDHLTGTLTITDVDDRTVDQQQWELHPTITAAWTDKFKFDTLKLNTNKTEDDKLRTGLYTATFDVSDAKSLITRRRLNFLLVDDYPLGPPAKEFGLDASNWPVNAWNDLPAILTRTGAGLIKLPAWRPDMSEDALLRHDLFFDNLLTKLERMDVHTIAALPQLPTEVKQKLALPPALTTDALASLLDADPQTWRPYLSFLTARYANRVSAWSIGRFEDGFYLPASRYPQVYTRTRAEFTSFLDDPRLIIPWNALYDFDPKTYPNATLELTLPPVVPPVQIPTYITNATAGGTKVIAHLQPLDAAKYARLDRLSDFAQRVILARAAPASAIMIDLPAGRQTALGNQDTEPTELLLEYRTLIQALGGATAARELALYPGVKSILFEKAGVATLALWNASADASTVKLDVPLGEHPVQMDILGHASLVPVSNALAHLLVSPTPMLILNVDPRLADLRASFTLGTTTLPAGTGVYSTKVTLLNPFPDAMTGKLQIRGPDGWTLDPASFVVQLGPGKSLEEPITLRYPYGEPAGAKTFFARLIRDNAPDRPLNLSTQVNLTSDVVEMQVLAQHEADGQVVLQQIITNISPGTINAQAYALVPDQARQTRFVLGLEPGGTVIKRFYFPAPGKPTTALLGLRQTDGTVLLTKTLGLE